MSQKNLIIILIIIIIVLTGVVGYFMVTRTALLQSQNNQNQQITDPNQSPSQLLCEKNGGKFLGVVEITNGRHSQVCLLPEGKYCEEFGYNKCVESKGNWKP